jgi:hypothetical protein
MPKTKQTKSALFAKRVGLSSPTLVHETLREDKKQQKEETARFKRVPSSAKR